MRRSPRQNEALALIAEGRFYPALVREDDGWYARWRAIGSENDWVDEYVRSAVMTRLSEDAEDQKHETLHDAWMMALKSRTGRVVWEEAACAEFAAELAKWSGSAEEDENARRAIEFSFETDERGFRIDCAVPRGSRNLRALGLAAYVWSPLAGLRADTPGRLRLELSHAEAEDFLHSGARELRDLGYGVRGVDRTAAVTAEAEVKEDRRIEFCVRVAGEKVSAEEIRFLLDQGSTLVFFRNRWIDVDRGILKEALRALEKGPGRKPNILSFALGIGHIGLLEIEQVKSHGWIRGLVNELRNLRPPDTGHQPPATGILGFRGELRDYQRRGLEWLCALTDHGFGALLADDMGLGKTVQVIAWLLKSRDTQSPVLIVAPLTLLSNWRHELARFAPDLSVYVHQGDGRHHVSGFRRAVSQARVTVTSYNLLIKDYNEIAEIEWGALVLDEAQAIKNPDTQASRAVRALLPKRRVALTGTPVENSVADIWALEDFLNPGFLGDRKSFVERFVKPIAADRQSIAARRLRHALEPFVLRRVKSDPRIAAELGEKREIREYCELTDGQRREYETALAEFRAAEHTQGDVFALITRLKLVCDGLGKFERLCELVQTIFENGESALVFTQYAKVGQWLQDELEKRLGRRFPFLHGGLTVSQREQAIAAFTSSRRPSLFILSLKAGGFGLNLTKATHVIHFDRWWNPAVENQATDRAHRIGQTQTVFVHLLISSGTLEEHVDDILQRKMLEAGSVITEAEWLEAAALSVTNLQTPNS